MEDNGSCGGVILLANLLAFVTLAGRVRDKLSTLAATAAILEAAPPVTATDTPGAKEELTIFRCISGLLSKS